MKTTKLGLLMLLVVLSSCEDVVETRRYTKGIDNVVEKRGHYLHYTIESGTVTCREHLKRAELACWKN